MRTLGDSCPPILAFVLVWAWGASYALDRTVFDGKMAGKSFWELVVLPVAVGLLGGYTYVYAYGLAVRLINGWFDGKAASEQIRRALIIGGIPQSVSVLGYAVLVVVFGRELFDNTELPEGHSMLAIVVYFVAVFALMALGIWSAFTTANALAEVQGYRSAWRAFAHFLVASLLLVAVAVTPIILWLLLMKAM